MTFENGLCVKHILAAVDFVFSHCQNGPPFFWLNLPHA